jgi:hypothetical protein
MSEHTCHCQQPATWMLRVVPTREVSLVEGHLAEVVLGTQGVDRWAVCDEHLAEAGRSLVERNDMDNAVLVVRPETD